MGLRGGEALGERVLEASMVGEVKPEVEEGERGAPVERRAVPTLEDGDRERMSEARRRWGVALV